MKTQLNPTVLPKREKNGMHEVVDRLIEIELELQESNARAMIRESDELKRVVRDYIATQNHDKEAHVIVAGTHADIEFGPVLVEKVVTNKARLKKLLGAAIYDQLAKFSLKDLEKFLNKNQIASVVREYYGGRKVKSIKLRDQPLH